MFAGVGQSRAAGHVTLGHYLPRQQATLCRVQSQPGPTDGSKDIKQVGQGPVEVSGMSSRYTTQQLRGMLASNRSISCSKVAGALQSPNGMMWNCYNPSPMVKAVFGVRGHLHLPVAAAQVEKAEPA